MGLSRCPECGRVAEPPACFACGYEWPEDAPAAAPAQEQWAVPDKGAAPLKKPEPIEMDAAPTAPAPLPISDSMDELGDIFGDPGSQLAGGAESDAPAGPPPVPADDPADDVLAGISLDFDDAPLPDVDDDVLADVSAPLDDFGIDLDANLDVESDIDDAALADIDLDDPLDDPLEGHDALPLDDPPPPPPEDPLFDSGAGAIPGGTAQYRRDELAQASSMPDPDAEDAAFDDDHDALAMVDSLGPTPPPPPLTNAGLAVSPEEIGNYSHKVEKFAEEFENEGKIAEAAFLYELKAFLDSLS